MAKKNIDLSVVLHDNSDYKEWLVELKERFYSHRLKASCATNGYLLDFYWKLGRDIDAKQYNNTYGSAFYKNLSQDLKNEMPGVKGFSPTNLKYMSYFYKLYAPLFVNRPQLADDFLGDLIDSTIPQVAEQGQNRQQAVDDFKLLYFIPPKSRVLPKAFTENEINYRHHEYYLTYRMDGCRHLQRVYLQRAGR